MCFEGKWLQNRLRADENESRSLLAVDIQGHQRGGFCIVPSSLVDTTLLEVYVKDFKQFQYIRVLKMNIIDNLIYTDSLIVLYFHDAIYGVYQYFTSLRT